MFKCNKFGTYFQFSQEMQGSYTSLLLGPQIFQVKNAKYTHYIQVTVIFINNKLLTYLLITTCRNIYKSIKKYQATTLENNIT